jgi:hypothetical protein
LLSIWILKKGARLSSAKNRIQTDRILDIKPYVPEFDVRAVDKTGWLEKKTKEIKKTVDDGRFTE